MTIAAAERPYEVLGAKLEIRNLSLAYGDRIVLDNVSLDVRPGQFVGLIGPNACGKSTLLKAVSRVLRPAAGEVLLDGRDAWRDMSLLETARTLAVVPQDFPASFPFTVGETVALGRTPFVGRLRGEQPRDLARAREAMQATGTLELRDRILSELAGGERQRVILAKALAQEPRLLLLDEPTSHLDINHQVEILDLLLGLNRAGGLTVVIVLHDLNLASMYCDYLYLLGRGGLVARGKPEEVLTAQNLELVYGSRVLVGRHPVYGCPQLTLVSHLRAGTDAATGASPQHGRAASGPSRAGKASGPVHVVAGGGSSGGLLESLVAAGYPVTAGPLNAGDSDWQVSRTLGVELVTAPPFSAIEGENLARAARVLEGAAAVLVGPVPFGPGNVAVLDEVLKLARRGRPVGIVTGSVAGQVAGQAAGQASEQAGVARTLGDVMAERDFTGGRAGSLGLELERAGAVRLEDTAAALAWVGGLGLTVRGNLARLAGNRRGRE